MTAPLHLVCSCGYTADGVSATSPVRRIPQPGDVAVCIRCGAANVLGKDLALHPLDVDTLSPPMLAEVRRVQRAIIARRPS